METIAKALGVSPAELVRMPEEQQMSIAALLGPEGAAAPANREDVPPFRLPAGTLAVRVIASIGDYRSGDIIWCKPVDQSDLDSGLAAHRNADVLLPRPAGRFVFGRLLNSDTQNLQILPLAAHNRQQIIPIPPWAAVATRLVRDL
jgi:hypothetical protein